MFQVNSQVVRKELTISLLPSISNLENKKEEQFKEFLENYLSLTYFLKTFPYNSLTKTFLEEELERLKIGVKRKLEAKEKYDIAWFQKQRYKFLLLSSLIKTRDKN